MEASVYDLLVAVDGLQDIGNRQIGDRRKRTERRDQTRERFAIASRKGTPYGGEVGCGEHPDRNGLSMSEPAVLRDSLECVSNRVAVVEGAAESAFAFILGDDVGFDSAGFLDCWNEDGRLLCHDRLGLARQTFEEIAARDHSVLDHLVEAGAELAARQRAEEPWVDDDERRLVERADQILAERVVDADFTADRAVDLCEQR